MSDTHASYIPGPGAEMTFRTKICAYYYDYEDGINRFLPPWED